MAFTFGQLRTRLSSFVKRSEASLTRDGVNEIAFAVNNVMLEIQRDHDFNWLRKQVYFDCSPTAGVLTDAKLVDDDSSVVIKRLNKAFLAEPSGLLKPIEFHSQFSNAHNVLQQLRHGYSPSDNTNETIQHAVQQGDTIWLYPTQTGTTRVFFDAVVYLDELVEDTDTNFLLAYGRDYLMYGALIELNVFTKDDERYQVSQSMFSRARRSLLQWDNTLVTVTDTEMICNGI